MMLKHLAIGLTSLALVTTTALAAAPTTDPVGDAALAERIAQMAQSNLAGRAITDTTLKEAAALLEAASKLDPTDARYPHLRAEACLSLLTSDPVGSRHYADDALDALKQAANIDGSDQGAQVQIIDLYAAEMESADGKIKYYQNLIAADKVAPEVRAHAAVRLTQELLDRGQNDEAKDALENALKFNPLDPDAVAMKEQMTRGGPPREHIAALMAMLRSNPAQPAIDAKLADELAAQGLTSEAAGWYSNAIAVGGRMNQPTDPSTFTTYVAELLIGNQTKGLDVALDSLLKAQPTNAQGLYLNMLLTRRGDDKDAMGKAVDQARDGFLERLYATYRTAMKNDPPTTRPSGELLERAGDVVAQAKQIKASGNQQAITDFASSLTDLAWLEIYFAQTPAPTAQIITALHELVPDDDVRFARLEGWALLVQTKTDEAKVKLSAVAERDPLSAMGMIRIASKDPSQKDEVKSSANTLLNENRAGLLGAMLLDGLRDLGAKVEVSEAGNDIKADLDKFPKAWFSFLDQPDNFYNVSCQALKVAHGYDEPMMAVVTIINAGPYDISIGPKGALRPDLYFDVNVRGPGSPQNLSGVAYDRLVKRLVLHKGETLQQLVRLDQPKLATGLAQDPVAAYSLLFSLVTNPIPGPSGNIAPGPGGQRVQIKKPVEREANPINIQRQQMLQANLSAGRSDVRMSAESLLAAYAQSFAKSKDEKAQAQAKQLAATLGQLTADSSAPVVTWARMLQISLEAPDNRAETLKAMATSDYWPERLLAAASALASGDRGKETLTTLTNDDEPIVKKFAEAALYDLAHPTTQPTTGPSTEPTTGPSAPMLTLPAAPTTGPTLDLRL
jgi:tetratricopeptide (TPR) repeat protein